MVEILGSADGVIRVRLSFKGRAAAVAVAGSFNDWDPERCPMTAVKGGFAIELGLKPGSYEYKFVVDGEWVADETNPNFIANDFGTLNSALILN